MENVNNKLVVIVPGSKTKVSSLPLLKKLFAKFYSHFGIQVEEDAWIEPLRVAFAKIPADTLVFEWSGGVSPFAVHKAAKELDRMLLAHKDKEIFLFTKSLGGSVAEKAARNTQLSVKRLVYVASPHSRFRRVIPVSVGVVNIFSEADNYLRFANRLLYLGFGTVQIAYALNIDIPETRHSDFNHNREIEYQGKKLFTFDFYRQVLTMTDM